MADDSDCFNKITIFDIFIKVFFFIMLTFTLLLTPMSEGLGIITSMLTSIYIVWIKTDICMYRKQNKIK